MKEGEVIKDIKQANISLILNSYEDIFSSFDPRDYSEKALSDDFLIECNHAALEKDEGIELILSMPKMKRNFNDELKIKKRLKEHFKKHFAQKQKERKSIKKDGIVWIIIGTILLFTETFIRTYSPNFILNMISLIMEPASWFSFWEGSAKIFIHAKNDIPDYDFYKKMANVIVTFVGY